MQLHNNRCMDNTLKRYPREKGGKEAKRTEPIFLLLMYRILKNPIGLGWRRFCILAHIIQGHAAP